MDFLRVLLQAPGGALAALREFYEGQLGLERVGSDRYAVGITELAFEPASAEPFYHFAVLVPGDRFDAALAWAGDRVDLLPGGDFDGVVFDFDNWNALACYFHDPAGNIVELIAHRGIGEQGAATGGFDASELLGLSELGLVGDTQKMAADLEPLGLTLWDGELEEGRLAFLGERARTLILSPERRGWLPTGRPAGLHPVDVLLTGPPTGEVRTAGHRVSRGAAPIRSLP